MNKQHPILLFVILALLATAPILNAQAQQPSEEQLAKMLKRFPKADTDKDGKLTKEEAQQFLKSRQRNRRPAAAAQPTQAGDAKHTETLASEFSEKIWASFEADALVPTEIFKVRDGVEMHYFAPATARVPGNNVTHLYIHGGGWKGGSPKGSSPSPGGWSGSSTGRQPSGSSTMASRDDRARTFGLRRVPS